ncbi:hypothetical protein QF048_006669 [Streptomyces sp. W4I9-2]|nr:hypothetical protein [Streptomyces sp. W4I9-2]
MPSSVGWYMIRHSSATTAIGTTTGRKAAERTKLILRPCPSIRRARVRPSSIDPAVWPTARTSVCQAASRKPSDESTVA